MRKKTADEGAFKLLKLSNPAYAYLELTYACEGQCPGCPALSAADRDLTMPVEKWSGIITTLSGYAEEVRLTGAEPTLHPGFLEILGILDRAKLPFRIYTNGQWPDTAGLMKALKKNRVFRGFHFSLHGSEASVHQFFTGPLDFDRLLKNIREAVRKKLPVSTSSIIGPFNHGNISGIMLLAASMGSRRHHFLRYIGPLRSGITFYREYEMPLLEVIERIPPRVFSYRLGECFPRCFFRNASPCLAGITHITITPTGKVKACPFSTEILATIDEQGRIQGRKRIEEWASMIPESCLGCDEIGACMGGCRTMRREFQFKRDPLMEEPIVYSESTRATPGEKPILLNGNLKLGCSVRKEKFGHILIREGEIVPVTPAGYRALSLCDGSRSAWDLEQEAGKDARDFLLSLYLKGFLELV